MNTFITAQIDNMKLLVQNFEQSCRMAALKDDGVIDKAEAKELQQIHKACEKFLKTLESVK